MILGDNPIRMSLTTSVKGKALKKSSQLDTFVNKMASQKKE